MTQDGGGPPAVSVRGLVKRYGEITAVDGVDLDVRPGETFGFLGPNGAGKSTTIGVLCTLIRPTSGTAQVADTTWRPRRARCAGRSGWSSRRPLWTTT